MVVITDVTSRIGSKVALDLLKSGQKVRGVDNNRERMAFLKSEGMELAVGEPDDPVFLSSVVSDAGSVLLIAPCRPEFENFNLKCKNFGEAAKKAIKDSKVSNVFFLSSMGAEQSSEAGLISGLRTIEQSLNHLTTETVVYFHPGLFMEHFLSKIGIIKTRDMIEDSTDGQTPLYLVSDTDVADYIVTMIKSNAFYGRNVVELYGDRLSYRQATKLIGNSIGIPELPYKQLLDYEMRNELVSGGLSIAMANVFVEMTHALSRGVVCPNLVDREIPNCPTRFKQFVEKVFVPLYNASI
jgi:uncharacterized protein YbjT (DUF2867 family)